MVSDLLFVSGFLLVATTKKNPEFGPRDDAEGESSSNFT